MLEGELPVRASGETASGCLPTCPPPASEPPAPSEEAGAPQAVGLAQVSRQGAAHVLGGGADALGRLDGSAQGLVELFQVLQVQLDGVPVSSSWPRGAFGGPLCSCSG